MSDDSLFDIDDLFSPAKGWVPPPPPKLYGLSAEQLKDCLRKNTKNVHTVYRLEKDGLGPYTLNDNWKTTSHTPGNKRYTPGTDLGFVNAFSQVESDLKVRECWFHHLKKKSSEDFLFGFSSIEQLLKWFYCHKEIKTLFERGYKIHVYRNVEGFDSGSQVIFASPHKIQF